ncbi:inositol monophosphatase [Ammoniphilus oxalaticus]|uniref:Inositol-1-monophosphatase n=2 Tax=Ammoniphilus oxalaticus TaxID=66863 RepID=A0A419SFB9_9BACL|nr:inositol monophosphatase [Ammoniphilus oxalaticus]
MLKQAKEWVIQAGEMSFEKSKQSLDITYKTSHSDLVTKVDKEVEKFLIEKILAHYPDHGIVGEEGTFEKDPDEFDTLWIIDPIDGTINFVHQQVNYVISVAVTHKEKGVFGIIYDPSRDELFWAARGEGAYLNEQRLQNTRLERLEESLICTGLFWNERIEKSKLLEMIYQLPKHCRGIRVYGCAALELAYVAAGRLDAYISLYLNPWDFAAGKMIVEEAGGVITTWEDAPLSYLEAGPLIASNPGLHKQLLSFIQRDL